MERINRQLAAEISEREQREDALRESEERYRDLFHDSGDAVYIRGEGGTFEDINSSMLKMFGYTREEMMQINIETLYADPADRTRFLQTVDSVGSVKDLEVKLRRKDRTEMTCLSTTSVRRSADGQAQGYQGILRDITERKRAEDARTQQAASLARADELLRSRTRIVDAQESLRKDISRQLHGTVQSRLILLIVGLRDLKEKAASAELKRELQDLELALEELLDGDIRSIAHQLHPSILRQGLVPALQSLSDRLSATLTVDLDLDDELKSMEEADRNFVPERVRLAAYRIVEEALTNVVKHANAARVRLQVELVPGGLLRLSTGDDGVGLNADGQSDGMGIAGMLDYAEVVGGRCVIGTASDGKGTEVVATLPLATPTT